MGNIQEQVNNISGGDTAENTITNLLYGAYFAIGIVAVIMIVFGGFNYLTSQGDASKITKGKTTILYGVIGLIIALSAAAITYFIINNI